MFNELTRPTFYRSRIPAYNNCEFWAQENLGVLFYVFQLENQPSDKPFYMVASELTFPRSKEKALKGWTLVLAIETEKV